MNLCELLVRANKFQPQNGGITGICVLCGKETNYGFKAKDVVSNNFSGWGYMYSGNCFCPVCAYLFSDQVFRHKSWVASEKEFQTFKNDEALKVLLNPPEPPFFIYIAKIGQKQSWLSCLHKVAQSRKNYFIAHEKYDVAIPIQRSEAAKFAKNAQLALDYGITKAELLSGEFHPKTYRLALEGGHESFLNELKGYRKNLTWEVIVDVSRGGTKNSQVAGDSLQHGELAEDENVEEPARHIQSSSTGSGQTSNALRGHVKTQQLLWYPIDTSRSDENSR